MIRKILAVSLSFVVCLSTTTFAGVTTQTLNENSKSDVTIETAEEVGNNPYTISVPERDDQTQIVPQLRSATLPATYLPGDPTAVKNQGTEGLCWAYSAAKSMELSTYSHAGSTGVLSPIQFANTFYKSEAVDQFNLTSGDRVYNTSQNNGGNDILSVFASMTQATPTSAQNGTYANVTQHPVNALFYDTSSILEIKKAIYNHGACTIAVKARDNNGLWYETSPDYLSYDHNITLIGWQDTLSKSNFSSSSGGSPSSSGAFRFVNSWGTSGFGDQNGTGGYGWISYEDVTFTDGENNRALGYDMTKDWDVDNVYQNDGCYGFASRTTSRCAELFSTHGSTGYEKIQGATIGLYSSGDYTAWVYRVQSTSDTFTDQVLLGKQNFSMPAGNYGYVTVYFDDDIVVSSGDTFAVAVTRADGSDFKMLVDLPLTYSFVRFAPTSPANSYYFDETGYSTADNSAPRIKVLTKDLTATDNTGTIDDYNFSLDYSGLMYTGEELYPTITIRDKSGNVVSNDKFKFTYSNNINASSYAQVTISSINSVILGTKTLNFTIRPRPLDDAITTRAYTGTANTSYKTFLSSLYVSYNKKVLVYNKDFYVSKPTTLLGYGDNSVVLYGKGNFNSSVTLTVQATANGVAYDSLKVSSFPTKTYTGKPISLDPSEYTIKYGTTTLTYGTDFRLTYTDNVNVGTATVNFLGLGSYTGSSGAIGTFKIQALNVNDCTIQTPNSLAYLNQPVTLVAGETITVFNSDSSVEIDPSNYTIDYTNNTNIGTMIAYVRGRNNLTGAIPIDIAVTQAHMENASITVNDVDYTGSAVTPEVTVKIDGYTLRQGIDYTLRYTNNVGPGLATVTVLGQAYVQGYKEATFMIKAPTIDVATVSNLNETYYYTGSSIEPSIMVNIGDSTLTRGTDYTLRFENNVDIGKAYIHIIGAGTYSGSKTVTFNIVEDPEAVWHEQVTELNAKTVSMNVIVKTSLMYNTDFDIEKVRTTNKKIATITKSGKIKVKNRTGKVTLELYGADDNDHIAITLNVVKPKFKKKKYTVKVGDTVAIDKVIKLYYITPSTYKAKKATVDEVKRTITFDKKGTVTLKLSFEGSSYHPSVKFKVKSNTVSNN